MEAAHVNADSLLQTPWTLHAICQQDGVQLVVQRRDSRFHTDPSSSCTHSTKTRLCLQRATSGYRSTRWCLFPVLKLIDFVCSVYRHLYCETRMDGGRFLDRAAVIGHCDTLSVLRSTGLALSTLFLEEFCKWNGSTKQTKDAEIFKRCRCLLLLM